MMRKQVNQRNRCRCWMLAIRMRRRNLMRCRRMANKAKRLDAEIVFVRNMAAYDSNNCMATDR